MKKLPRSQWLASCLSALALLLALSANAPAQEVDPKEKPKATPQQEKPKEENSKEEKPNSNLRRVGQGLQEAMMNMAVPRTRLTDGPSVRAAFRSVVAEPSKATVRVMSDKKKAILGGIIGPDGWILTKASLVKGDISVKLKDGREFPARVVGIQDQYDLAMLKIDAHDLPVLKLARDKTPVIGQWIATPDIADDPIAIGVLSVNSRVIPKKGGVLGIQMADEDGGGVRIERVVPNSGAAAAGILVNDLVTAVNGKKTKDRRELVRIMQGYGPGETVEIEVQRGKKQLTLSATLTDSVEGMAPNRSAMQNNMGSVLSQRRYGFPSALQHSTVLKPEDCGGPLVNLDGETIGFNIARSGRTESYAIPTPVVMTLLYDLMSGNLAPKDANLVSTEVKEVVAKKEDPKKEEPKKTDAKKEVPKKEVPKKEESKKTEKAEPKKEAPMKEEPKKETPMKEAPKQVEPKQEAPKKEAKPTPKPAKKKAKKKRAAKNKAEAKPAKTAPKETKPEQTPKAESAEPMEKK